MWFTPVLIFVLLAHTHGLRAGVATPQFLDPFSSATAPPVPVSCGAVWGSVQFFALLFYIPPRDDTTWDDFLLISLDLTLVLSMWHKCEIPSFLRAEQ